MTGTVPGPDGHARCGWCGSIPGFFPYHDREWGYPVADDQRCVTRTKVARARGRFRLPR